MTTESSYTNRITIIHRSVDDKNLAVHKVTRVATRAGRGKPEENHRSEERSVAVSISESHK